MTSLDTLRERLHARIREVPPLSEPEDFSAIIAELSKRASGMGNAAISEDAQRVAITEFLENRSSPSFKDLRLVAFGLGLRAGRRNVAVLDDRDTLLRALKEISDWHNKPSLFRRCYLGLVASYFAFDAKHSASPSATDNWIILRDYLLTRVERLNHGAVVPNWVRKVDSHRELFSEDPCRALAQLDLRGRTEELGEIKSQLLIGDSSWFVRELFLAKLRAACASSDSEFVGMLPNVLPQIKENQVLHDEGLGIILNRYAAGQSLPLHRELRDHTVSQWGNPWLLANKPRWGNVNEETRTLLGDWLKLEFIESFFTLLAEDGQSEPRRMEFWKRYINEIDDIRFALGKDARDSRDKDFLELRKKAAGLTLRLEDNAPGNAFIMTMKDYVFVEFSGRANALYVYNASGNLPFDLTRPVRAAKHSPNSLKSDERVLWLKHQDGIHGHATWEAMFDLTLRTECFVSPSRQNEVRRYTTRPSRRLAVAETPIRDFIAKKLELDLAIAPPAPVLRSEEPASMTRGQNHRDWTTEPFSIHALSEFCSAFNLEQLDRRSVGGNLWIRTLVMPTQAAAVLRNWGFQPKAGKGWWR